MQPIARQGSASSRDPTPLQSPDLQSATVERIRTVISPILVGRDDLLAFADRRLDEVIHGDGRLVFIAGEAGIGKTRLLQSIEQRAQALGMRTVRAGMYPSDLEVAAAVFVDLASAMQRDPALASDGSSLRDGIDAIDAIDAPQDDPLRRRRTLVLDLADALAATAGSGPVLLALEDLHWADDLSLEVLAVLARRVAALPILVVGTYRSDELYPRIPMREWRARLITGRLAEEVRLRRLTSAETATMIAVITGADGPVALDIAEAVQARTDGIPLHVEELLAVLSDAGLSEVDAIAAAGAPDAIEDTIAARLRLRSERAATVAAAGAVIGRSFDLDLLAAVLDAAPELLSEPLSELADHHLVVTAPATNRIGFRHALICDAVYDAIPPPERRRLHLRTADAASRRPEVGTDAFLSLHYERAGRPAQAFTAALAGARAATQLSSHREARELYARAVRTMPTDLEPAAKGAILAEYAERCVASDQNAEADGAFEGARAAYLAADRPLDAAALVAPQVAARHLLGDDLDTRAARLHHALTDVETVAAAGDRWSADHVDRVRARLLAGLGAAYMLDRRLDEAIDDSIRARTLAARAGDGQTERHAATTLGACLVFAGRMDEGWRLLEDAIGTARSAGLETEAARAYRMLGSSASVLLDYSRATAWLREGIGYADRVEAWNDRHYMAAHLAHVAWATGEWEAADHGAAASLADGRGGLTTRITALHVIGYVALGRGDLARARAALAEARALGTRMHELQRRSPAVWGQAEIALLTGATSEAIELVEDGLAASTAVADAAYLFPYVVTGTRAYLAAGDPLGAERWVAATESLLARRAIPGTMTAVVHARGLLDLAAGRTRQARGALEAARAGWSASGRVWEGTWARLDVARAYQRANMRSDAVRSARDARDVALALGAAPIVTATDALIGRRGAGASPDPWAPLTAREYEVARLVAAGGTNAAIAAELGVSPRTASAHVEHILTKLGVARRAEIAAWVAQDPVLHSRPHGDDREE